MRARRVGPLVLLLATASVGCAGSVGAEGGGGGVEVGAGASTRRDGGRADDRTCMFDRASGRLRTCLHFSFGRCAMFGDPCSKERREAAPPEGAGKGGR